jgi:hypothetical protein
MKRFLIPTLATAALCGAAPLADAAPAWCKGVQIDGEPRLEDLSSQDPKQVIEAFTKAACAPNEEVTSHAAQIEQSRKAWGKRLGMEEADWVDTVAWLASNEGRNTRFTYSSKDLTAFTAIDQYISITGDFGQGEHGDSDYRDWIYAADAFDPQLTEVGRLGIIKKCLRDDAASTWAICQGDIDAFDVAKFNAQLRADTAHAGDEKMELRFEVLALGDKLKEHKEKVAAAWKQDPAYKQMFEVTAKGRAEWAAGMAKQTDLLALVLKMDSAMWSSSRKQHEGCEATTSAALAAAAAKIPGAAFKGMKDEREDPFGGFGKAARPLISDSPELTLAAMAYIQCQPDTGTSSVLGAALDNEIGYRGPRSMAWARMLSTKIVLDDAKARIDWPGKRRDYGSGGMGGSAGAVIKSTKIEGDLVIVQPAPLMVKVEVCEKEHSTGRISRIRGNGEIEYESVCDKSAMVSQDHSWAPFKVKKQYAPLLTKGAKFSASYGRNGDDGKADIIAIWPNEKTEVPSWFLGAKVK